MSPADAVRALSVLFNEGSALGRELIHHGFKAAFANGRHGTKAFVILPALPALIGLRQNRGRRDENGRG